MLILIMTYLGYAPPSSVWRGMHLVHFRAGRVRPDTGAGSSGINATAAGNTAVLIDIENPTISTTYLTGAGGMTYISYGVTFVQQVGREGHSPPLRYVLQCPQQIR